MASNTSLSVSARLALYLGPPATALLLSIGSPKAGLLSPMAFIPSVGLYNAYSDCNNQDPNRRANLEPLIWTTLVSATAGVVIAAIAQGATGYGLATAFFGTGETRDFFVREGMRASLEGLSSEDITRRAKLAWSWQNLIFNAIMMFGGAGLTEEAMKYLSVSHARRWLQRADEKTKTRSMASLDYALAYGLGIGLVETLGSLYSECRASASCTKIALTIFERLALGSTAHLMGAALTALCSVRKDREQGNVYPKRSWSQFFSIIAPSMLLHGANNFGLLLFSAYNGNLGFIHPTSLTQNLAMFGMYCTTLGATGWLIRKEWKEIQELERKAE